ncbi:ATP-binding protein [Streptomyces sp. NPDC048416]|uniref:ATP-binding protein n=1 Tax=Streptomyces sp. NPDC048416 TaxID=3365546 RepID=UPI003711AAB3
MGTEVAESVMSGTGLSGRSQIRRLRLFGVAGVVSRCRDFTAVALDDWGWTSSADPADAERVDDVLLLVSEVVTNACLHAAGPRELVLRHRDGHLRVEVTDASSAAPVRRPRAPSVPGGHGLMLLDRLAARWGSAAAAEGAGKTVWLEVVLPSSAARDAARSGVRAR